MEITNPTGMRATPTWGGVPAVQVITCADVQELRDALDSAAAAPGLPEHLVAPVMALCARAKDAGLRVEEALLQLKRAWRELPGSPRFEARSHRDTRLDQIVTALIEHYFE